ncbi:MAG TPA: CopG family transcriptional regulator [Acidimicrobiales bacterium]|nr:CopG family transcriptional regulator [Acidimicrobiales bacterium]
MPSTPTQIYLSEDQRQRIDEMAKAEGVTMAEVVRRALEKYLPADTDAAGALQATFGADPEAQALDRREWDRG